MSLPCVELETAPNPRHAVIWLHGLGADGHDFEPIVPELVRPGWPPIRFVFPHAPVRPVSVNAGMRMRAWFDIASLGNEIRLDEAGIRAAIGDLDALVAREAGRDVAPERIVLAGFSQGGSVVLAGGLRHRERLAGIAALSTWMPLGTSLPAERNPANAATPVFLAHGEFDPVVAPHLGATTRAALTALGQPCEWHTYPMAHQVCGPEIADLARWLGARFC